MKLWHKRLLYASFFLLFLILTPLLIFYTGGFQYSFKYGNIQKTGLILIEAKPVDLQIYLNGKLMAQGTPVRLKDVAPGEYLITLSKDGYYPWQSKITVKKQQSVFIKDVTLIKKELPNQLLSNQVTKIMPDLDGEQFAYLEKNQLTQKLNIFSLAQNNTTPVAALPLTEKIELLGFAHTNKKILYQKSIAKAASYFVYNLSSGSLHNLTADFGSISLIRWHPTDDNLLYFVNQQGLWEINLFEKKVKLLEATGNISDFWISAQQKIIIVTIKGKTFLKYQDLLTNWEQIAELPAGYQPWGVWQRKLIFLNTATSQVLLIDLFEPAKRQTLVAKNLQWWDDHTLLAYNDWEVYFYNLTEEKSYLINRFGQAIKEIVWLPQQTSLVINTGNALQLLELADLERLNTLELVHADKLTGMFLDYTQKSLYFFGQIGKRPGVYQLKIFD